MKSNFKFITVIIILVLVFNFSLVRAEETTLTPDITPLAEPEQSVPAGETGVTIIKESVPATDSAPSTLLGTGGLPQADSGQATIVETEPLESTPNVEIITPEENLTSLISTTSEPIIFDFSPSADSAPSTSLGTGSSGQVTTETPEANNNVAGASESIEEVTPILHEVLTGIVRDANIKGLTILAQWQMSSEKTEGKYLGKDDSSLNGAQFLPSGQFSVSKPVVVCALVADAGGVADINNISATINYPENIAKAIDQAGDASAGSAQVKNGCGRLMSQVNLEKVSAEDTFALVCDKLRNNNNNLLAWGSDKTDGLVYNYGHLCGNDGLLEKSAAELYCAETALAYDDPAGDYLVKVSVKNNNGVEITGENPLKYLELTTFENDFSDILYGPVKLNETKILAGDLNWGESTDPTVRNTGNTRLQIKILQNDFGLGKTGYSWNLSYQAKVGTSTDFINYLPEQTTTLNGILELGQWSSMDFSVLINKFPEANSDSAYWGKMTLSADKVAALGCSQ